MATLVLDVYTKHYPEISNRIRCALFLETAPLAVVASIIDDTVGHPSRFYHFPGLYRNNYKVSLDEIDGGGTVLANIALFDVVPAQMESLLCRPDEQIHADETNGFESGATSFVFDGTDDKPDYRGWTIVPSELNGRGILIKDVDYSWVKETGTFQLLLEGDIIPVDQYYNIHFDPQNQSAGNSYPTLRDFSIKIITEDTVLDSTYFDGKLIVEPVTPFTTVTLPDINTIVVGRPMMVELSLVSPFFCVKFEPAPGQNINFFRGNLYAMGAESFWIYRLQRPDFSNEWRVSECDGNFRSVGQEVSEDFNADNLINKIPLDGSSRNIFQFARLYNEFVLQLPLEQVVNYDEWTVGNNKYLYSLANASDPGFADEFHVPDRRGLFEKNNDAGKAGDFEAEETINTDTITDGSPKIGYTSTGLAYEGGSIFFFRQKVNVTGTKIVPNNYSINKYVVC